MNAERLHALLEQVLLDYDELNVKGRIEDLYNHLNRAVSSPGEPSYQAAVAGAREALQEALQASFINGMSAGERELLAELGILGALGEALLTQLDEAFESNQITPSIIVERLTRDVEQIGQIEVHVRAMVAGFKYFDIPAEDLAPGECEITMVIPRPAVGHALDPLGAELRTIHRLLGPFQELGTGSRGELEVRTISSSDYLVNLIVDPKTGAAFAVAVAWILAQYKAVLDIRKLSAELRRLDMPADADRIEQTAENRVMGSIDEIAQKLIEDFGDSLRGEGRANEVRMEVRSSIRDVAKRVDIGFQMQVRALPPQATDEEDPEDQEDSDDRASAAAFAKIAELRPEIEYLELEDSPIFSLEDGDDTEGEHDEEPPPAPRAQG